MSREELMRVIRAGMARFPSKRGQDAHGGDLLRRGRGVNLPARRVSTLGARPMSLFLDIGTGAGLASATGVRPYLPPLLAGGLARGGIGIGFDGTDFRFLESPAFLAGVLALGVVGFLVERSAANRDSPDIGGRAGRGPAEILAGLIGI